MKKRKGWTKKMKNLDWKTIVNKIISWGFPAVFAILGIGLMAAHKHLGDTPLENTMFLSLGAVIAILGAVLYGFLQVHNNNTVSREAKIDEMEAEIEQMKQLISNQTDEIIKLTVQVSTLKSELDRKQAKIDKLTDKVKGAR